MRPHRVLFAGFEPMRREMDELFGDVLGPGLTPRRAGGFSPAIDVFYETPEPPEVPRAVVHADLAGVPVEEIELEIEGRELVIAGHRRPAETPVDDRVYQQLEIETGAFRRVIALGVDVVADAVRATYRDGILRVELPLAQAAPRSRPIPIRQADPDGGA